MGEGNPVKLPSTSSIRETGLSPLGRHPWGTHICLFYETESDLLDVNASYLAAGLRSGERCLWALPEHLNQEIAIDALRKARPEIDRDLNAGSIMLLPGREWYLRDDEISASRILASWHAELERALKDGYQGLRGSGNSFWTNSKQRISFCAYEQELNEALADRQILMLCTYALDTSEAADLLATSRAHHFSISRCGGSWEFFESPEFASIHRELERQDGHAGTLTQGCSDRCELTERERIVLEHIFKGESSKEAARSLQISPRTVEFHRRNIMRKLGARNTIELLATVLHHNEPA